MGAIQNSINYALGTAAIAAGLTNKKQAEKAQDKLDDKAKELANKEAQLINTEEDLAKTTAEKEEQDKTLSALKDEENMQYGLNTYNVSNDIPTAKETNVDNAGDKSVSNKSVNPSMGSALAYFIKNQQKVDPYMTEQIMGFRALKMLDSRIAAKKAVGERSKTAMIRARARENGGNE